MNIYLIGMPGSGKSSVGLELSKKLKIEFIDSDEVISNKYRMSIGDIFEKYSEKTFRDEETLFLKNNLKNKVISTGGGIILKEENLKYFKGIKVFLNADLNTLKKRLEHDNTRPLLKNNKLEDMYSSRINLYRKYSDIEVDSSSDICSIVNTILEKTKKNILVINGPNLNMLGKRKKIYGDLTLEKLNQEISSITPLFDIDFFQSNHEGDIIDIIQKAHKYDALIINPAAFTHYSIGIRDAMEILTIPKIEVHLTDIYKRESFRNVNLIKDVCDKSFVGLKEYSYYNAINYLIEIFYKK